MSLYSYLILLIAVFCSFIHINDAQSFFGRPIFGLGNAAQMVRHANTQCRTDTGETGTCLTSNECDRRQGTGNGACANGAGTCCSFRVSSHDNHHDKSCSVIINRSLLNWSTHRSNIIHITFWHPTQIVVHLWCSHKPKWDCLCQPAFPRLRERNLHMSGYNREDT